MAGKTLITRDKSFYSSLIKLALPITLQNIITFAISFADNLMVGTLGEYAISGVYIGNQIQTFLQFFVIGVDNAMLILAAQYWGRGDLKSIRSVVAIACRFCIGAGVLVTAAVFIIPRQMLSIFTNDSLVLDQAVIYVGVLAFSYIFFCISQMLIAAMRSIGKTKVGMYISFASMAFNVVGNYVLIFGKLGLPALGIKGAAIATLISRIIEAGSAIVYVFFIDDTLKLRPSDFLRFNATLRRDLFKYGLPVLLGQVVWAANTLTSNGIIGHMSAEATAAISIAGMMEQLLFLGVMGLGAGLGILTGKTVGAGQYEKMREYSRTAQILFATLGVIISILILLIRKWFLSLYTITDATYAVAMQFMTVQIFSCAGRSYQATCIAGLVKAGGDTKFQFINDTIFVFCVVLPAALIAQNVFHASPLVVYACLKCDQILKCIPGAIKINRYRWMKNLTRDNPEAESKAEA